MKKRKNSGLLLAARMAAGRAARRIGARVAVAGKRVARKYGKRLATYGVNELEARGQKLLETASGSARQRIARMNPEISSSTVSKAEVDEILRSIYRKYYSDKKLKNKFHRGDKVRFGGDVYRVFDYDLVGNEVLFAIYSENGRVHQFVPAAALTLVSAFSPNKKALAYYGARTNSARMNPEQNYTYEDARSDIQAAATQFGLNRDDAIRWSMGDIRSFVKVELTPRARRLGGGNAYTVYVSVGVNGRLKDRMDSHPRTDKGLLIEVKKAIAMIKKWASVVADATETKKTNPQSCADVSWPPHKSYQLVSRVPVYIPRSNPGASRRKNPTALEEANALAQALLTGLHAPFVKAPISKLGGDQRPSVMLVFSLDPRESWSNGILENSRYARISFNWPERKFEHFSGYGMGSLRKSSFKDAADAVAKINKWIASQPKSNPKHKTRKNPKFPIKAVYDGGGGVGLIPVSVIGLRPKRYDYESDHYDVVSNSKTSKVFPKGYKFVASKTDLVSPDAIRRRKYGTYIVAHTHVLDS